MKKILSYLIISITVFLVGCAADPAVENYFVTFTVDGITHNFTFGPAEAGGVPFGAKIDWGETYETQIIAGTTPFPESTLPDERLTINIESGTAGEGFEGSLTYNNDSLGIYDSADITVNITVYSHDGGVIAGTFSGIYTDYSNGPPEEKTLTGGVFRVTRDDDAYVTPS